MKKLYDDLWQTSLEHPFAGLNAHAYFLQRGEGSVLFYNTSIAGDLEEISNLGGISFQYLSHRHESGNSLRTVKAMFDPKLCADVLEEPYIDSVVDVVFSVRQHHSSTIEVIPTPGHTEGGLCFYYESHTGLRYLFTGDTLFQSNGEWGTLVLSGDGGSAEALVTSLSILGSLEPDVVLCSASLGDISVVEVTQQEWHKAIDTGIAGLK
jgi:hypothetical protein